MIDWTGTTDAAPAALALVSWWLEGALILAAGALVARLLARRSAASRHLAWSLAIVASLALPIAAAWMPRIPVSLPEVARARAAVADTLVDTAVPSSEAARAGRASSPVAPRPTASGGPVSAAPARARQQDVGPTVLRPARRALAAAPFVLGALWLSGALFLLARSAADRMARRHLARRAVPSGEDALLASAREALGVRRPVRLLRSPDAAVPMTWGVLRPVVVLPAESDGWSAARRRQTVCHELAHVARLDVLWLSLAELLCALAWIDPLAWIARRGLRREAEHACDDTVLAAGVRPSHYAGHLLQTARELRDRARGFRGAAAPATAVAMARSPKLADRIAAVLDERRGRQPVGARQAVCWWLAAAAVGLSLAALSPAAPAGADPAPERHSHHRSYDTDEPEVGYFTAPRFEGRCERGLVSDRAYGTLVDQDDDRATIRLLHGHCKLTIEIEGDVELRPDARGVRRMPRGARMTIEEHARVDRELVVTAGPDGKPRYRWSIDGERGEIDDEARSWFRGVLVEIFRAGGFQAKERVAWLLDSGGVPAVVDEVRLIPSDHTAGIYLGETVRRHRLTASEATAVLDLAGESIGSDHELSELMMAVPTGLLADRAVEKAYVDAARSIGSDHDASEVLLALLERHDLSEETLDRLMAIADDIGSDHDAAEVLLALIGRYPPGAPMPRSFYRVAGNIGSDHDLAEVLLRTIDAGRTDEATLSALLEVAEDIGSDHDLAEVLVRLAETVRLDGALRERFLETAEGVGSSHDHDRVMEALAARGR